MTTPDVPTRGCYLVLEAFHRAGKTTQVPLVIAALKELGIEADAYEEPPRPGYGRQYVQENPVQDPVIAAMLMYADRRAMILGQIVPGLEAGRWAVCSRNFVSSFHLQGMVGGVGTDRIAVLHDFAMRDVPNPDVVVWLDVSAQTLSERSSEDLLTEDYLERSITQEEQSQAKTLYQVLNLLPNLKIHPVDAVGTIPEVTERIMEELKRRLPLHLVERT